MNVEAENAVMRERAIIREGLVKKTVDIHSKLSCSECGGSGATSSPSSYDPCKQCDGTGFNLQEGCLNDLFEKGVTYIKTSDVLAILSGDRLQNGTIE